MNILIANTGIIPVTLYGGTERVIWYLGKELVKMGHRVTYLVNRGSSCEFAQVIFIDENKPIGLQVPADTDIAHFNFIPSDIAEIKKPYVITIHGNTNSQFDFDLNTIFVSENHAARFGSKSFVHNGLDWDDYMKPGFSLVRNYFHFLGDAAWRVKNVRGAIGIIRKTRKEKLKVLGGNRFNFRMGMRFTLSPRVSFYGLVGGSKKNKLLVNSKGLIFPVRWHEPFGLAITESLYAGCPVFGTPYGSLPEIVTSDVGFLSNKSDELVNAVENAGMYPGKDCHEYAAEKFNSRKMALAYLEKYERVLSGRKLNDLCPRLRQIQQEKFLPWE